MCSGALVLGGLQVASGLYQAQAQYQAGVQQKAYYDYLAETSRIEGEQALKTGQKQSEVIQDVQKVKGKELAKTQAQQRATQEVQLAATGVPSTSVTAQDIGASTIDVQKLDELALRYNADVRSYETMQDATYRNWAANVQAGQYTMAGDYAKQAGKIGAFQTLLGTATSLFNPFAGSNKLWASGNVSGTGIFGTKLFGKTQSEILGTSTKAWR